MYRFDCMKKRVLPILGWLLLTFAPVVMGQTNSTTTQPAGQGWGSVLGNNGLVMVTMVDAVDSSAGGVAGRQFRATVARAFGAGSATVAQGASATVGLVQNGATFSLALTSVVANGQAMAVNGTSPTLGTLGGLKGTVTNSPTVQSLTNTFGGLSSIGGFGRKQTAKQQQPASANNQVQPSAAGARVYVPAGTAVSFRLVQNTQTAPATQNSAPGIGAGAAPVVPAGGMATTPVLNTAPSSNSVLYENILYQLQGCQRQAPHIICNVQITNQRAVDAFLSGGQGTYYVDQAGNKVGTSSRKIANCIGFGNCQLLPGVAMAGSFEFVDEEGHATSLVRLLVAQSGKAVAQFNNVPIQ
jgi:hypothetical protein